MKKYLVTDMKINEEVAEICDEREDGGRLVVQVYDEENESLQQRIENMVHDCSLCENDPMDLTYEGEGYKVRLFVPHPNKS